MGIAPKTSIESPALKQKTPNSNSKQKKFSTDDLKSLRSGFAKKQGVIEVVEPIYDDLVLPKNNTVQNKIGDNIQIVSKQENETQLIETKNINKGDENGEIKDISCKQSDQVVNKKIATEVPKDQETEHLSTQASGFIDMVQDFKDFSSLKRKPKVKTVEPAADKTNSSDITSENIPKQEIYQNKEKETFDEMTIITL